MTDPTLGHVITPDDNPEPGDRCKNCGRTIVWIGPSTVTDWEHVPGYAELPADDPNPDEPGTCPRLGLDGTPCGEGMGYAHTVREYHPVRSWTSDGITVGETNDIDGTDEPASLFCANGHEWAVPTIVEFE